MSPLHYTDTRGLDGRRPVFTEVLLEGIAEGGGLYVPESVPQLSLDDIAALASRPYHERALRVYEAFQVDVPHERTRALLTQAYGQAFHDPDVAPVRATGEGIHLLELWHGPTAAFKDMALQAMPRFFAEAVTRVKAEGKTDIDGYLILVATSGDTGKAALEGFADRDGTGIVVFYPAEGVSELQRLQMVTQRGANVAVYAVRGNFDDCQTAVKTAFTDEDLNRWLRREHGVALSSANSINWGRLLPQIVYYVSAYADLVACGAVAPGKRVDFAVPTGNFGNILAGYYARRMGVPVGRLLCASNENRVLADFLDTGIYDLRGRDFVATPSPSMDILISSNLERALYELSGDPVRVTGWMQDLRANGSFAVDPETLTALGDTFLGDWVSNAESLTTIRNVYETTGHLLDPHTAVAWRVAERHQGEAPVVVVGTAHWSKFGADVFRALKGLPPAGDIGDIGAELGDVGGAEVLRAVRDLAPGREVHPALSELDDLPVRFRETIDGTPAAVAEAVRRFVRGTWMK